tara:strand:+ start:371 stop:523 length:153 start_codon:yes stop_codon:yes gene_type:complete
LIKIGATVDKRTNTYTFPAEFGSLELIIGCIGATQLAAASATLALTLSMY